MVSVSSAASFVCCQNQETLINSRLLLLTRTKLNRAKRYGLHYLDLLHIVYKMKCNLNSSMPLLCNNSYTVFTVEKLIGIKKCGHCLHNEYY